MLPKQSSYVITSADSLLSELLTQRGVGTMFKKVAPVTRYSSLDDIIVTGQKSDDGTVLRVREVLPDLVHRYQTLRMLNCSSITLVMLDTKVPNIVLQ